MAIYHFQMKTLSRSAGRSATAAAAYRAGQKIEDERTGMVHDYSKRSGVLLAEVILPDGVQAERSQLWNAAERAEKRCNSVVAREFVVALPHELSREQQTELIQGYARGLSERTGWGVDVALHDAGKQGDLRNVHAHLLCTTRKIERDPSGCLVFGSKTREWDNLSTGSDLIRSERSEWARCVNESLELANRVERVDCRSHAEKQSGLEPQIHLGPMVMAMERKGIETERGEQYREIARHNETVLEFQAAEAARIDEQIEQDIWKFELEKMQKMSLFELEKAREKYKPKTVEERFSADYLSKESRVIRSKREALSELAVNREKLLEDLERVQTSWKEVHYQWELQMVTHPWQTVLNDMNLLPVAEVSRIKQGLSDLHGEEQAILAALKVNTSERKAHDKVLSGTLEKVLPKAEEAYQRDLERYRAIELLIKPKQEALDKVWFEAEIIRWEGMDIQRLSLEAKRCESDPRELSFEYPEVKEAYGPLSDHYDGRSNSVGPYAKSKGKLLERAVQDAESGLKNSERDIQEWKRAHPVKALLYDKNMAYPSGEYAGLLTERILRDKALYQATKALTCYQQGRAKSETKLEKAIETVMPECEKKASENRERYLAIEKILSVKQRVQEQLLLKEREERKRLEHERGRGRGMSL